jgi:hypothetical protein
MKMEKGRKKSLRKTKKGSDRPAILEEPQILTIRSSNLTEEEKAVRSSLRRIPINARRKAFSNNSAVTIIRDGKILRVHCNRKARKVGVVKKNQIPIDISKPVRIK